MLKAVSKAQRPNLHASVGVVAKPLQLFPGVCDVDAVLISEYGVAFVEYGSVGYPEHAHVFRRLANVVGHILPDHVRLRFGYGEEV